MDLKERLEKNEAAAKQIQVSLQRLQQDSQNLLQELLRLDGERRLIQEMIEAEKTP